MSILERAREAYARVKAARDADQTPAPACDQCDISDQSPTPPEGVGYTAPGYRPEDNPFHEAE